MKTDTDEAPTIATKQDPALREAATRRIAPPPLSAPSVAVRKGPGLGMKFFVAAATLLIAVLGGAIAFATVRANQVAEKSILRALEKVPAMYAAWRSDMDSQLRSTLRSIAEEPGTKALPDPAVDAGAQLGWTQDKQKTLGAKTVFLFDWGGVLLARNDRPEGERASFRNVKWVATPIETMGEGTATIREGKVLSSVAAVPIIAGDPEKSEARPVGVVAASMTLDDARAEALKGITGGEVAFLANTAKRGEAPNVEISSATREFNGGAFLPAFIAQSEAVSTLFTKGDPVGPLDVDVAGDRRVVAAVPLKNATGDTLGAFVVSRSRAAETAAFREIRNTLVLIGLAALVFSIPVSLLMGRRIARPLEQLAGGAAAIREGNLDVQLPEGGSDEVGLLARAFRAMVGELKEKAELERMVAEMRKRPTPVQTQTVTATAPTVETAASTLDGPQVGKPFAGRYKILSQLGKGGMGAVYLALDKELDEEVAMKVLMPEAFDEGTVAVQTLKQEIRLARKITHPNVVRTHDLGESDGTRFLTMEYVPGTTLKEVIDRKGSVALGPGLQIAKQVCRGLGAVHEAGIIHRDIKPHNVMVLPNGVVKLMDFGIARAAEGDPTEQSGQTVGTPYYMSPEQARGETLDPRSDIYAMGVVLYEMFTGQRPFDGRDPMEVMRKHILAEPERPSQHRPDMPPLLEKIVLACLAKDTTRRPPSANDLYSALQRVAA